MTRAFTMRGPCAAELEVVVPAPVPASARGVDEEALRIAAEATDAQYQDAIAWRTAERMRRDEAQS